jgi:hypothetical protein
MQPRDLIKIFFILTFACLLFFGIKGLVYAVLSAGIVFAGFVVFCLCWGILIFLSDRFEG